MVLRDSIDELDALIEELTSLRRALRRAEQTGEVADVLWDAEAELRHVAGRANARASVLRRAIELHGEGRLSA